MIVDELKDSILESAIHGKLVSNSEENANVFLQELIEKKASYLKRNKFQSNKIVKSKNKKFILPSNWVWTSVGEVCFVTKLAGFEYTKYMAPHLSSSGDVPVVRAKNIKPNYFINNCDEYISSELSNTLSRCALNEKCTLMTFIGAGIGEVAIFDKDTRYHLAPNVAKIVPSMDINKYLMYYFMSPTGRKNIFQYKKQTAQPSLSMETIRNVILPLPPLEELQRIVDKIEELFAKLSEIKPIEEELKFLKDSFPNDMINSILNDAYTGKLINQNTSVWNSNKLIDCCKEIVTGNSISESIKKSKYTNIKVGYNYIATKDLKFNHTFNYDNGIKIPFDEKGFKYAKEDDILLCIEGGSAGKKIGILNETVCYGNKLCRFSTNQNVLSKFLYYYLQSPIFLKNFNSNLSGIIGGVSINKIKNIELKYPSIEVQQRIVDKIEQLLPLCNDIEKLIKE